RHFADAIETTEVVEWDGRTSSVTTLRRTRLGAITLAEARTPPADPERAADVVLARLVEDDFALLPWSKETVQLRQRLAFLHRARPSWPDVSDEALRSTAAEWLRPFLSAARSAADLARIDLAEAL